MHACAVLMQRTGWRHAFLGHIAGCLLCFAVADSPGCLRPAVQQQHQQRRFLNATICLHAYRRLLLSHVQTRDESKFFGPIYVMCLQAGSQPAAHGGAGGVPQRGQVVNHQCNLWSQEDSRGANARQDKALPDT
jgi:hypothetical protein